MKQEHDAKMGPVLTHAEARLFAKQLRAGWAPDAQQETLADLLHYIDEQERQAATLESERAAHAETRLELEQTRVQLAGCLTAADGATRDDFAAHQGDYGWSLAYQRTLDLARLRDSIESQLAETARERDAARKVLDAARVWRGGTGSRELNDAVIAYEAAVAPPSAQPDTADENRT